MTAHSHIRRLPAQSTGIKSFFTHVALGYSALQQRRALERLDDAALNDIGVTREEATAESRRWAWDVPDHWRN